MSEDYQKKFHKRLSVEEVEEGNTLSPKFDENGLIPCVTTDSKTTVSYTHLTLPTKRIV